MILAVYKSGGTFDVPTIRQFETVEAAKAFVASRVNEVWFLIDETGREVE